MVLPHFGKRKAYDALMQRSGHFNSVNMALMVCAVHLLTCVLHVVLAVPGSSTFMIGNVPVKPRLQWVQASFDAISIMLIVAAVAGLVYHIERHLIWYWYLLLLSASGDVAGAVVLGLLGKTCDATGSCSLTTTHAIVGLAILAFVKVIGLVFVGRARRNVRVQYYDKMLPHMKAALEKDIGGFWGEDEPLAIVKMQFPDSRSSTMPPATAMPSEQFGTLPPTAGLRGSGAQSGAGSLPPSSADLAPATGTVPALEPRPGTGTGTGIGGASGSSSPSCGAGAFTSLERSRYSNGWAEAAATGTQAYPRARTLPPPEHTSLPPTASLASTGQPAQSAQW